MVDPFDAISLPPLEEPAPEPAPAKPKPAKKQKAPAPVEAQEVLPPVKQSTREPRPHQPRQIIDDAGRVYDQPKVDLDEVEMMASVGMTTKQIAEALHIPVTVFGKLVKNDPVVQEAIDRGVARGVKMVTDSLFQNAMKGNVAAQIFWLKNRGQWQDKQELDQKLQVETKMSFDDAVEALKAAGIDPSKI